MNWFWLSTLTFASTTLRSWLRQFSIFSGNTSATAVSSAKSSAFRACAAAPVPRPPQPTNPTFRALLTLAPFRIAGNPATTAPPRAPDAPVLRNWRRPSENSFKLISSSYRSSRSRSHAGVHPPAGTRRFEHGFAHFLGLKRRAKIGLGRFARFQTGHEIGQRIQKRVFISDAGSRHPIMLHKRVLGVGGVNFAPSREVRFGLL